MKDRNVIPYMSKCVHLDNTIYTKLYRAKLLMSLMNCINALYQMYLIANVLIYITVRCPIK